MKDRKRANTEVQKAAEFSGSKSGTGTHGKKSKLEIEKAYLEMTGKYEKSQAELKKVSRRLRQEIKHREKIESKLDFCELRFHSLTTCAHHHLFVMNSEGRYLSSNMEEGLSVSGEYQGYIGKHQRDFHSPDVAEIYDAQIKAVLQTGKPVEFEHFAVEEDGLHHHLDTLYPISEGGRIIGLGGICRDVTGQKDTQQELVKNKERFRSLFEKSLDGVFITLPDGTITNANAAAGAMLGMSTEEICRAGRAGIVVDDANLESALDVRRKTGNAAAELTYVRADGTKFIGETSSSVISGASGGERSFVFVRDITERKQSEFERETTVEFLHEMSASATSRELIEASVTFFQRKSGCVAVGVRLQEDDDYPYFETSGFSPDFLMAENSLCAQTATGEILRDRLGNPVLECMCGNVIKGRIDPSKPFFTSGGSFWTNSTTELLSSTTEADRKARTRNRCHGEGYESVALIPLFYRDGRFGLLQLNDRRKGLFTPAVIALWERLAGYLSVSLTKLMSEEALSRSEALLSSAQRLAKVGAWEWDVEKKKMSWTEETYRIHDLGPGDLISGSSEHIDRSLACYEEQDRPRIVEVFRRCAEQGVPYDLEFPFTTATGRRLWIRTTAEAVYDGGRVARVVGNIMDITDRKQAEEILKARLRLSESSGTIDLGDLLQQSLDEAERITGSRIGFVHFVGEDQKTLPLQMWSTQTLGNKCTADTKASHYNVDAAGVWADCIRERRPVIHNDYASLPQRKGLPPGHVLVARELVVPILRNDRVTAVFGVGNKPQDYNEKDVVAVSSLANLACDIVLRNKAEEQLELQGLVLDQARDRITLTNLAGVITHTNQAEFNARKRQRDELIGKHISEFCDDPPSGATPQEIIDATLAKGEWRGEVVDRASDGTESVVDLRTFLVRSKSGKALAICRIGIDVTERKNNEEVLRESEERFRRIFDESPVGAAIVSSDFHFLQVNAALCRITGYSAGELNGVKLAEITHPDDIAADISQAQQLLRGEIDQYDMEKRYVRKDGTEAWIHMWVKLLRDGAGRPLTFFPIMEDITERKKAERDLRLSETKLRDLYRQLENAREEERRRISREIHDEMGQNITALKVDLSWLKKNIEPHQTCLLEKIDLMNKVADATLNTARRISAELRPGMLDALGLAAAVEWMVRDFEKRNEIQCELHIGPEEIEVENDVATDVFRILQEALTNVVRHAQASKVWVTLRQTPDEMQLNVIDDGIGISEERLFHGGSMGLMGIRERLLLWGGTLNIHGLPGEGTSIRAIIPVPGKGRIT